MKRLFIMLLALFCLMAGPVSAADPKVELYLRAKLILDVEASEHGGPPIVTYGTVVMATFVNAVAISPSGRYAASAMSDNTIMVWDLTLARNVSILKGDTKRPVMSVAFSPDSSRLVSGGADGVIKLWDFIEGRELWSLTTHSASANTVAFSQDNRFVMSGHDNQEVRVYNAANGSSVLTFKTGSSSGSSQQRVTPYAFSKDGKLVLSANEDNIVVLWSLTTGKEVRKMSDSYGQVYTIDFSPDGRTALIGSGSSLFLTDVASGNEIRKFKGHSRLVRSAVFSQDGVYALSGSHDKTLKVWDVATGREIRTFEGHEDDIKCVAISPDRRILLSGSIDMTTRFWNIKSSEEVVRAVKLTKYLPPMFVQADQPSKEDDFKQLNDAWVMLTPDGYYNGSPNALGNMNVVRGMRFYRINQFYDVFYRPDIIIARLRGEDTRDWITTTMDEAIKSPPPDVDIDSISKSDDEKTVEVKYVVKDNGGGIGEIRIFYNGKLVKSDGYYRGVKKTVTGKVTLQAMDGAAIRNELRGVVIVAREQKKPSIIDAPPKGDKVKDSVKLDAIAGENEVGIVAFNRDNTVQSAMKTETFKSSVKTPDPHLYVLAVGIDEYKAADINLKFAVKDADGFAQMFRNQSLTQFKPENIHVTMLKNKEAGRDNVLQTIKKLSETIKPNDVFILFTASHGVLQSGLYSIVTHDYDGNLSSASMINSNDLMETSKNIKALTQIYILDTCHAGGLDNFVSGLYDARMSVLARNMGLHMFASASSTQEAMDGYKGKNGMYTYTLLEGLNNNRNADDNKDGKVSIYELGSFSRKMTMKYSSETGHSQTPVINNFGKDTSVYIIR